MAKRQFDQERLDILLSLAAKHGKLEFCKVLVGVGADVNYCKVSKKCVSVLMGACFKGELETVKYLVECGADMNYKDKSGCTALTWSIKQNDNRDAVSNYLLQKGADLNTIDEEGCSVLHIAAVNCRFALYQRFLALGVDLYLENNKEEYAIDLVFIIADDTNHEYDDYEVDETIFSIVETIMQGFEVLDSEDWIDHEKDIIQVLI